MSLELASDCVTGEVMTISKWVVFVDMIRYIDKILTSNVSATSLTNTQLVERSKE
jgi:hypothetical protein